ncbi:MAG TPA: hypothetical protein PLD10_21470 [Rhodopila sp.]|nr:hypothetical protein [Rhodopila sp.]
MKHDRRLQRLLDSMPRPVSRTFDWLMQPHAKWVRIPLGSLMIAGGFLGFLPILGFWMVPVGALLIGEDIPPVRRATLGALGRVQHWWDNRRPSRAP